MLDEIVQSRRNTKAAKRLLIRLLKKQGVAPKRMITDKLRSYGVARRQVMPNVEYRSHKGLNNHAENSHLPLHKRERVLQGFRSPEALQCFVSIFSALRNLFVPPCSALAIYIHRLPATHLCGRHSDDFWAVERRQARAMRGEVSISQLPWRLVRNIAADEADRQGTAGAASSQPDANPLRDRYSRDEQ